MGMKGNYTWEMATENRDSKIKEPETIIKESHFLADRMVIFSKQQVIDLMKAAQRQAIQAAKESFGKIYDIAWDNSGEGWNGEMQPITALNEHDIEYYNKQKSKAISDLINSPELKVI